MDFEKLELLRTKALEQAEEYADKERYGLFSYPPPVALGDSSYKNVFHPRDPDSKKPITKPRNIQTNPMKKGRVPKVYLDGSFITNGEKFKDPYYDPSKIAMGLTGERKIKKKGEDDDKPPSFFPVVRKWNQYTGTDDKTQQPYKRLGAPYEYMVTEEMKVRKNIKDEDGRVITKPRNIQAMPYRGGHYNSTIGHTINPYPPYECDPYGVLSRREYLERKKWNHFYSDTRGLHFKSMCFPKALINEDKSIFGGGPEGSKTAVGTKRVIKKKGGGSDMDSDRAPFKPSNPMKKGEKGYIGEFLRLVPQPMAMKKRKKKDEKDDKEPFKPSRNYLTRPTPSITLHMSNVRPSLVRMR